MPFAILYNKSSAIFALTATFADIEQFKGTTHKYGWAMKRKTAINCFFLFLMFLSLLAGCEKQKAKVIGSGPTGGGFESLAIELGEIINRDMPGARIKVIHSGGSIENLTKVDNGQMDMALVYAEDAYRGRLGLVAPGQAPTLNVRAVMRLFGASAHLIVPETSLVQTPFDLKNRRVAIGNPGSGAAGSAKIFFTSIGIWEQITPIYVGAEQAMNELKQRSIDALWLLSGFPNEQLQESSTKFPVRILNLFEAAAQSVFFQDYPYYSLSVIPAGTYKWQTKDAYTFQDEVLWVANSNLDESFVYQAVKILFQEKRRDKIRSALPADGGVDINESLVGVKIPLHPGAIQFLRESL